MHHQRNTGAAADVAVNLICDIRTVLHVHMMALALATTVMVGLFWVMVKVFTFLASTKSLTWTLLTRSQHTINIP